jgi:hypothetical protein
MKKTLLLALLLSTSAFAAPSEAFWRALHKVETGGRVGPIRSSSGALGPLQIKREYFIDSRVKGSYSQVSDLAFARKVAEAYFKRYAPEAYRKGDAFTLARVHNGGPSGHRRSSTLAYGRKVLNAMK